MFGGSRHGYFRTFRSYPRGICLSCFQEKKRKPKREKSWAKKRDERGKLYRFSFALLGMFPGEQCRQGGWRWADMRGTEGICKNQ
ncbi:hypothetical protein BRADI_1g08403v3 [Brachypodium distachyon]|uniref:Uncharacterized protein n=1 Tax=Brachypodium distachyon TaxID=15368 RepID=A0A2K2DIN1_BRADI|nr:hypothetical protein BRADI_1g08403v3 [Brachypodium distachyon]